MHDKISDTTTPEEKSLQVATSKETILFPQTSPEQYAIKIWGSVADNAVMTPLQNVVKKHDLDRIKPLYVKEVIELASSWIVNGGVANPYTMMWVRAVK